MTGHLCGKEGKRACLAFPDSFLAHSEVTLANGFLLGFEAVTGIAKVFHWL